MYDVFLDILSLPEGVLTPELQLQIVEGALALIIVFTFMFYDLLKDLLRQFSRR